MNTTSSTSSTSPDLVTLGLGAAILYAAFKFGPQPVKAMALGIAGVAVAKYVPGVSALVS